MKDWIFEQLEILEHSNKTLILLMVAVVGFMAIMFWGSYQVAEFKLSGTIGRMLETPVKLILQYRWEGLAFSWLVFFIALAIKAYKKDKKRFHS